MSLELVRTIYPPRKGIRLLGVTVSGFEAHEAHDVMQMALAF